VRLGRDLEQMGMGRDTEGDQDLIPLASHVPQGRSIYPRLRGIVLLMGRGSGTLLCDILFYVGNLHHTRSHPDHC
jgi:hypothetical protein